MLDPIFGTGIGVWSFLSYIREILNKQLLLWGYIIVENKQKAFFVTLHEEGSFILV